MFCINFNGVPIGHSNLENGDPPMGCAEGVFKPNENFPDFAAGAQKAHETDPAINRWTGLNLTTADGVSVDCTDVVLMQVNFGDETEYHVDAIGIGYPLYEVLFPGRYAAYEDGISRK